MEKQKVATRMTKPEIEIIPTETYVSRHISAKSRTKLAYSQNNLGHEIYTSGNREYLAIFCKDRIETKPLYTLDGKSGILKINGLEAYTSLETKPTSMIVSSCMVHVPYVVFTQSEIEKHFSNSNIRHRKFKSSSSSFGLLEEINLRANGVSLNFSLDRDSNMLTLWSTIIPYKELMEQGIDPLSKNSEEKNIREMTPIDFSVLQLNNIEELAKSIKRN